MAGLSLDAEETSECSSLVTRTKDNTVLYHTRPGSESLKMKCNSDIWNWREQIKIALTKKLKLLHEKLEGKLSVLERGGDKWKKEG